MKLHTFHDLYRKIYVFQATLPDAESVDLPSWLTQPTNPDICVQLRYLLEVAKYLQTIEEEAAMSPIDIVDEEAEDIGDPDDPNYEPEPDEMQPEADEVADEEEETTPTNPDDDEDISSTTTPLDDEIE